MCAVFRKCIKVYIKLCHVHSLEKLSVTKNVIYWKMTTKVQLIFLFFSEWFRKKKMTCHIALHIEITVLYSLMKAFLKNSSSVSHSPVYTTKVWVTFSYWILNVPWDPMCSGETDKDNKITLAKIVQFDMLPPMKWNLQREWPRTKLSEQPIYIFSFLPVDQEGLRRALFVLSLQLHCSLLWNFMLMISTLLSASCALVSWTMTIMVTHLCTNILNCSLN